MVNADILAGIKFFYLITAIVLLTLAIVVYPTLRYRAQHEK